jgi:hypothetical protein
MTPFLTTVASMRPDAIAVWRDPEVARSLAWYRKVMTGNVPAKFILCRKIPAEVELNKADENELLSQHRRLSPILSNLVTNIQKGSGDAWIQKDEHPNLLDLKSALVNKTLEHCNFCEWRCNVNRTRGKIGFCRLDNTTSVGSHFHHYGEEAPLVGVEGRGGSGTIFFESCNAHCVFCIHPDSYIITQNGPRLITQLYTETGVEVKHEGGFANFQTGIYTFSAEGRPVKVTKIFRHDYKGLMIAIKPLYGPPVITTPEHEILAADGPGDSLVKLRAEQLSIGHWVAIPRPNTVA